MNLTDMFGCEAIAEATYRKTAGVGWRHAVANLADIRHSIAELEDFASDRGSALVICAGPSLHRQEVAGRLRAARYQDHGVLVSTDGALGFCLRHQLIPDVVVSLDPHPTRIVRWFGDPELTERPPDDYFRRQDLDPHVANDEARTNRELIELVNRYGPQIRAVLSTSVSRAVTRRVQAAGMPIFWWNPIYDDYDAPHSMTRHLFELTRVPCMVAGGNCGTAAWVFAGSILKKQRIGLIGMDLSYPPGTPLESTQYYPELQSLLGARVRDAYREVWNPYVQQTWYTDPTYWWYRESFLALARQASVTTDNCTEGGILFGEGVQWSTLETFLADTVGVTRG